MTDKDIDKLVGLTNEEDYDKNLLKVRKKGLLLTDNQVSILERNGIDPSKCGSTSELLYVINSILDGADEDEYAALEDVAKSLDETRFYEEVNR